MGRQYKKYKEKPWVQKNHPIDNFKVASTSCLIVMEYLFYRRRWTCSNCRNHNPVIFTQMWHTEILITGFILTWATQRVTHVDQDMFIIPEHLRSPSVFVGVRVSLVLVFFVVFCVLLFDFLSFFVCFCHGNATLIIHLLSHAFLL